MNDDDIALLDLTSSVVVAYVSNTRVHPSEVPVLIKDVHAALAGLAGPATNESDKAALPTPAQIRRSITPDALISFIDGKPYKLLKRHLTTNGFTMEQYKIKFGLPTDYPKTAAAYSETRSKLAMASGLGRGEQRRGGPRKAASNS